MLVPLRTELRADIVSIAPLTAHQMASGRDSEWLILFAVIVILSSSHAGDVGV